jgi:O-antigen biosynthesis protein
MLFSIITPEHSVKNFPFLLELWESIQSQTYTNWEWILYTNNGCKPHQLPANITQDARVKVINQVEKNANIGFIKNQAFFAGSGDILVEADHDDILHPECLMELYKAYTNNPEVGFVYSDNIMYNMKEPFVPYSPEFGWTSKVVQWRDAEFISMNTPEPTSQSLSFIWYAPDHVRSWKKSIYHELGGHNPAYSICDDHELMIRTYLHTTMFRIPKALYVYRITGNNTWLDRNKQIQQKTVELFHQYAMRLAEREAELRGLLLVDMGGGINQLPGYLTIDQIGADINCDLNHGIPLEDNSVGVLNASHVIEHLRDPIKTMREIHRVLAHGGWAFIEVPSTDGRGAWQDPTHVSYWNQNSFWYYTEANLAKYIRNTDIKFQSFRCETWFPNQWLKDNNIPVVTAWMCAIKPDGARRPHTQRI